MVDVTLPAQLTGKDLVSIAMQLGAANRFEKVVVDFSGIRYFEIQPMCFLLGKLIGWNLQGKEVEVRVPSGCRVLPYMQRMDFFKQCGIEIPENFVRQGSTSRFREFTRVELGTSTYDVRALSSSAADCIAPDQKEFSDPDRTGFYDAIEHVVSEMLLNTVQHARGPGFLCAQYYPSSSVTQLALADAGMGIRESFERVESPHTNRINTDGDAIRVSLEGSVSSTSHKYPIGQGENPNSGVGLTVLTELTKEVGGSYVLMSGEAAIVNGLEIDLGRDAGYKGTYCAFTLPRSELELFDEVKERVLSRVVDDPVDEFAGVFS